MKNQSGKTGIWTMAARNISRRPRRSVLSATAIGVASLTMVVLLALLNGMILDMGQTIRTNLTGDIVIQHKDFDRSAIRRSALYVPQLDALRDKLSALEGVVSASPRISGGASVFVEGEGEFFSFTGLDFNTDPLMKPNRPGESAPIGKTAGLQLPVPGSREVWISRSLADRLLLKTGDTLTAITQTVRGSSNGITFIVKGIVKPIFAQFSAAHLFMDIQTAQRFVHLNNGATTVLVVLKQGSNQLDSLKLVKASLGQHANGQLSAVVWQETSMAFAFMPLASIVYNFIGLFFFALASTVMINTMLMVVLERSREIGTLAAMGMDRHVIRRLFLAESAILSGIGAAIGTCIGCGVSLLLNQTGIDFSEAMQGVSFEISPIIRPVLDLSAPFIVFFMATAVAVAFTVLPVRHINRMKIVEALRNE